MGNAWGIFIMLYLPCDGSHRCAFLVVCSTDGLHDGIICYSISYVPNVIQEIATALSTQTY